MLDMVGRFERVLRLHWDDRLQRKALSDDLNPRITPSKISHA